MTSMTLSLKGTKEDILPKLAEAESKAKDSNLMTIIIRSLIDHVNSVKDDEIITFSIRGSLVVQELRRNHKVY